MERPQNRPGSCLATWEGPGDGLSRLAAFFFFWLNLPSWLILFSKWLKLFYFYFFGFLVVKCFLKNKNRIGNFFQISLLGSSILAKNVKDA
jgi:hypothetical protein